MISTKLFKVQEELWGHRYLMKTFSDEYKLGHSADLGVNVSFKPISFVIEVVGLRPIWLG